MHKWPIYLIVGGIVLDVTDAVTDKSSDGSGGVFYGPGKPLATVNNAVPIVNLGMLLVAIGGAYLLYKAVR